MSRATLVLANDEFREKAIRWIRGLPAFTRVEFKAPKRTLPQNAKMWIMLTEVAEQLPWHGMKLTADDWKLIFLDGLKSELRLVPNMAGNGFVNLGRSSSDLSVPEMADLIELIGAFGASNGVKFNDFLGPETARKNQGRAA
jgi:hypothetical protein